MPRKPRANRARKVRKTGWVAPETLRMFARREGIFARDDEDEDWSEFEDDDEIEFDPEDFEELVVEINPEGLDQLRVGHCLCAGQVY